jgi:CCR4-NOT transcription complex subunit 1
MDNTINSLVSKTVGFTDQQVKDALAASPGLSDAQLAKAMETYGVSPSQLARVVGVSEGEVAARVAATIPPGQTVTLGDTIVQPQYQTIGSGEDQQIGGLENVLTYKANENKVGGGYNQYNPDGTLQYQGTQQEVNANKDFLKFALGSGALFGGAALAGLGETGTSLSSLGTGGAGLTAGGSLSGLTGGSSLSGLTAGSSLSGLTGGTLGATNSLLGGAALGSTLGSLGATAGGSLLGSALGSTAGSTLGSTLGSTAGSTLGSTLGTGAGSALGTSLATGLGLSALGSGLGAAANQQGISDARNLINQYGGQAGSNLNNAYANAQNLGTANRQDLANIYANTGTNLQNLYNQQVGYQQPYQDIGSQGASGLGANADYFNRQFTNADLNANLAPNYAFQLQQGQMANQRAANMGGGSLGGNALQGLQRYTQDYAGNAYQNAFNNFNTQRQNIYGNLSDMAKIGSSSAGQLAGLGNQYGSNLGSLASNYGGNLTQGYGQGIGAANAYGLNTANLATGIGSALASNATQSGANNAALLSNLGNTALLGSMLKAT